MDEFLEFLGWSEYSLDEKGRLSIPAKYRRVMEHMEQNTFILTMQEQSCITLYPYLTWRKRIAKPVSDRPHYQDDATQVRRSIGLTSADATLDKQGRITIPPPFCDYAKIEKNVGILGCVDRLELWNPDIFEQIKQQASGSMSVKEDMTRHKV